MRVAVELREIDGVPLRAWVSEILKDGEAHQNEKDTLAEEVNNFILQALEPLADRCGNRLFCKQNGGFFCTRPFCLYTAVLYYKQRIILPRQAQHKHRLGKS